MDVIFSRQNQWKKKKKDKMMPMRKGTSIVFKMNLIFINFAIKKWGIGDNSDTKIISAL